MRTLERRDRDRAECWASPASTSPIPSSRASSPLLDTTCRPTRAAIGAVNTVVFERRPAHRPQHRQLGLRRELPRGPPGCAVEMRGPVRRRRRRLAVAYALLTLGRSPRLVDLRQRQSRARSAGRARCRSAVGTHRPRRRSPAAAVLDAPTGRQRDADRHGASIPGPPSTSRSSTPSHWVAEIVYFPAETALILRCAGRGCRTLAGLGNGDLPGGRGLLNSSLDVARGPRRNGAALRMLPHGRPPRKRPQASA